MARCSLVSRDVLLERPLLLNRLSAFRQIEGLLRVNKRPLATSLGFRAECPEPGGQSGASRPIPVMPPYEDASSIQSLEPKLHN